MTPSRTLFLLLPLSMLLLAPLLGGCGRVTLDLGAGGRSVFVPIDRLPPGVDAQYDPSPEAGRFEIRTRAHWIFWAVPLNHPDWERETRGLLSESEGIGDLVVETRTGTLDVLAGVLTLGFYRTTRIVITGSRIRLDTTSPSQ